jgi:hypothetical protein
MTIRDGWHGGRMTAEDEPGSAEAPTVVFGQQLPWTASPAPLVWRKRLFHAGPPEAGTVTSIVRYDAGAGFRSHAHPEGEEILVLSGTFSDERGDFQAGSYMLNPEGFVHAPFSNAGCLLFVKLRQYRGRDRERVLLQTNGAAWRERAPGVRSLTLYRSSRHPEHIRLTEIDPGAAPRSAQSFSPRVKRSSWCTASSRTNGAPIQPTPGCACPRARHTDRAARADACSTSARRRAPPRSIGSIPARARSRYRMFA